MKEVKALSASGILGYGFPVSSLLNSLKLGIDYIACDAGSTDPGPHYLGSGESFVTRESVKRDLKLLLQSALEYKIPLIIGSAGGSGSNEGVENLLATLDDIVVEEQLSFKCAIIRSELTKKVVLKKFKEGKINPLQEREEITKENINDLHRIVASVGPEPVIEALKHQAEVIISGRITDASLFASYPLYKGINPDTAWAAAKIIECGAATAFPKSHDNIVATMTDNYFIIETPNKDKVIPWENVAAHSMYENESPFTLLEPGGTLDSTQTKYEQLAKQKVMVTGSRFHTSKTYTVKLEGVTLEGYRTICLAGVREPTLLSQMDDYLLYVKKELKWKLDSIFSNTINHEQDYKIQFKKYGFNAVMGENELHKEIGHEIGLLIDVIAKNQELSKTALSNLRTLILLSHFEGRKCISGNVSFPFSPADIYLGEVYHFALNHIMELNHPLEHIDIKYEVMSAK